MTTSQIIACALAWTAALAACIPLIQIRRARRQSAARYHLRWSHGGGTFAAGPLTEAEFDALTARIRRQLAEQRGGQLGDGQVCDAYRLPTTAEDSGLCAQCGMFDYKHREKPGA